MIYERWSTQYYRYKFFQKKPYEVTNTDTMDCNENLDEFSKFNIFSWKKNFEKNSVQRREKLN